MEDGGVEAGKTLRPFYHSRLSLSMYKPTHHQHRSSLPHAPKLSRVDYDPTRLDHDSQCPCVRRLVPSFSTSASAVEPSLKSTRLSGAIRSRYPWRGVAWRQVQVPHPSVPHPSQSSHRLQDQEPRNKRKTHAPLKPSGEKHKKKKSRSTSTSTCFLGALPLGTPPNTMLLAIYIEPIPDR
jgi:hypothetical protein